MGRTVPRRIAVALFTVALLPLPAASSTAADPDRPPAAATAALWQPVRGPVPRVHAGHPAAIEPEAFRAFRLDHAGMGAALALAPPDTRTPLRAALEVALPAPDGGFERFRIADSPVMEAPLAARHPDIGTYRGNGLDDPTASVRLSLTPLGFHASVRGQRGAWYIDPYYHRDRSLYASYFGRDLRDVRGPLVENPEDPADAPLPGLGDGASAAAAQLLAGAVLPLSAGDQLRTYRLALASDPTYASYFDPDGSQPALVTAGKVALINRVRQIYEDELSVTLVLVANNDRLNFDTWDLATGADGPCGAAGCYTSSHLQDCGRDGLLARNRTVLGQIIGASNYDIGHLVLGREGGGLAGLGVVGGDRKAAGCTGIDPPVGDQFAVDYVAHEAGHQFAGQHTFNGTGGSCSSRTRAADASVEPGSGSSIMAYAGICPSGGGGDNLQSNTDPHFSQRSFSEITAFVTGDPAVIDEVQTVSLRDFDTDGDAFTLTYAGSTSSALTRGTNYSAAGIAAALAEILPAGAATTVEGFDGTASPDDTGFQVTFGGTLAGTNVQTLEVTDTAGASGFVGETAKGGATNNQGWQVTPTGNSAPAVTTPASFTIPYRTPFALTGEATDADGDPLTFLWEQNDPGATAVSLRDPDKTTGPLFRQFSTGLDADVYDPQVYDSPGLNHPGTVPTRVFPDLAQILAGNTNAMTGDCPGTEETAIVECYSEFLPTQVYPGPMQFRLTARDGQGGVGSADTTVALAPGTGPFLVTAPGAGTTWAAGATQTVTWDVAGTAAAPISATQVDILLSTDGGATFPHVLAASTPNDGSQAVVVPEVGAAAARVQVRAVGNVFFDISDVDIPIVNLADVELLSKTAAPDPAYAGETVTYTLEVRNNGPSPSDPTRIVDRLPAGTSYVSSSVPCAQFPAGTLWCDAGRLEAGGVATVAVTAAIARDLVHQAGGPVTLTNTAAASSSRDDPDPGNNDQAVTSVVRARADLQVTALELVGPPVELLVGESATITLRQATANRGPSAPMDTRVTRSATTSSNVSVALDATDELLPALDYGETRPSTTEITVACTAPGPGTVTLATAVAPDRPDDTDPDLANNSTQATLALECIVPVAINIKPGSARNPIGLFAKGDVPVAVLSTAAGEYGLPLAFDATAIDALTARFGPRSVVTSGGGAPETHGTGHVEDALERTDERTRDGDADLVLHFATGRSGFTGTEVEACVRGRFGSQGFVFQGCDVVTFVPA